MSIYIVKSKKVKFISDGINLAGVICYSVEAKNLPGILFLHGGGQSSKERFKDWQNYLARLGMCSLAFDFRGVGESKGQFVDSSLKNRLTDAKNALNFFLHCGLVNQNKIAVIGSSMGAFVAIKLAEGSKIIKALILVSAAAYAKESEEKQMDISFTKVIRRKNSWHSSTSFSTIKSYKNPIMLVYGSEDLVVPEGIKNRYKVLLKEGDIYLVIKNGLHALLDPKTESEHRIFKQVLNKSSKFLERII